MKDVSRYGDDRIITQIEESTYRVHGKSRYVRWSTDTDGVITMYDFEGGPAYFLGQGFPELTSKSVISKLRLDANAESGYGSVFVEVATPRKKRKPRRKKTP